jgi:selenocysteine lyase/cysteine desulfurase
MMERRSFFKTMAALIGSTFWPDSSRGLATLEDVKQAVPAGPQEERWWRLLRRQFIFPEDYTYLNTAGIGTPPHLVMQQVQARWRELEVYPGAGHDMQEWGQIKAKCAALMGKSCTREEIALTSTATEGINIIVNGLPLQAGDEVITSTHEHAALNIALLNRMQRHGIGIRTFEPDMDRADCNLERIERLITPRTRLIFISHITCTTGQLLPVKEIGRLARARGLWFALDGAQAVGQMPVNIDEYGVDFYTLSGHKWLLGPKRTGILYVRKELLETLRPCTVGAYSDQEYDIRKRTLRLYPTAQRYEYATQNAALFYGLGVAIDFINLIGIPAIWRRNRGLAEMFYRGLCQIPAARILSPSQEKYRTAMITFKLPGTDYRQAAVHFNEKRIRVRIVPEVGLEAIRVSFHLYNSEADVARILEEIRYLAGSYRGRE